MSAALDLERRRTILAPIPARRNRQPRPVSTCPAIGHKVKVVADTKSYGAIRFAVAVPVNTITVGVVAGGTG
jgi:hypothetical protein